MKLWFLLVKHLVNSFMSVSNRWEIQFHLQRWKLNLKEFRCSYMIRAIPSSKYSKMLHINKLTVHSNVPLLKFHFLMRSTTYLNKMSSFARRAKKFSTNWFLFSLQQLSICRQKVSVRSSPMLCNSRSNIFMVRFASWVNWNTSK